MSDGTAAGSPGDRSRRGGARGSIVIHAAGASATFTRAGDRWAHRVSIDGDPGDWQSLEGDQGPAGSVPPVITDVMVVGDGGKPPALVGVGHAGSGHCSLAVTVDPADPATLCFEVACRLSRPWPGLGSAYARVARDRGPGFERGAGGQPPRPAHPTAGLVLVAAAAEDVPEPPCTVIWRYRIGPGGIAIVSGAVLGSWPAAPACTALGIEAHS